MRQLRMGVGVALAILLAACSTSANLRAPGPALPALASASPGPEYVIGANDLLNIVVFQVKDLERDVRVDNTGQIALPLIGTVQAAGLGVHALESLIQARYGARFLQNPQVSVFVKESAGQRVTVEGAVTNPGIFPITGRLSLLQAVALAKGPTNVADEHDIIMFRTTGGLRHLARFDLGAIREGRAPDPEVLGEDIVVVGESGGKVALRRFIELTPLLGVWSLFRGHP